MIKIAMLAATAIWLIAAISFAACSAYNIAPQGALVDLAILTTIGLPSSLIITGAMYAVVMIGLTVAYFATKR